MYFQSNSLKGACYHCPNQHFHFCKNMLDSSASEFNVHAVKHLVYLAKQYLYHQGDMNHDLLVLREGWVMLTRLSQNGNRQVFRSVLPGELIGFQYHNYAPATYSAIALLDTVVCKIPKQWCATQPELSLNISLAVARDMFLTELYLTHITHCNARERIAFMVLELYHRLRDNGLNQGYSIQFPLRQEAIADTLGLTAIHVSRTLHAFREEGLLEIQQRELTILNYAALCRLAGSEFEVLAVQ